MTKTAVVTAQQRWEYLYTVRRSELALQDELNELGQQGWELVSFEYYKDAKGVMGWIAFLKRPSAGGKPSPAGATETAGHEGGPGAGEHPVTEGDVFDVKQETSSRNRDQPQ
ncbi:MAG: hypothetical protein GYA33_14805 [Thermogutta sp.]|nr:hypothetical protein [Thermogutta sp.]